MVARALPAAYAGLLPVVFIPISVDAYILPRVGLTLIFGALILGAGLVAGRLSLGSLRPPAIAVAAAALLALALSVAPNLSLVGEYGWYESAPVRLAYLGLFCGAAWIGEREWVVTWFLAGCAVASVEAVAEWLPGPLFLARPDGNLGQANLLGVLLAMAVPLAVERGLARPRWLLLLVPFAPALLASSSRSGWLAALTGIAALVVSRVSRRRLAPAAGLGLAALAGAVLAGLFSPLRLLNRDTGEGRIQVWRDSLRLIAARPLEGWGEDTFASTYGRYQTGDWSPGQPFARAHSMPLDLAATQGLLGLAACAWFFVVFWRGLWRRPELGGLSGACAAYLVWSLVNFDWAPATGAFWLLAGTAWSGVAPARRASPARRLSFVCAAMVALALALAIPVQVADMLFYAGRADRAATLDPFQPRYAAASGGLDALRRASSLHDPNPGTYVALGDAFAREGNRDAAATQYRRALKLYPFDRDAQQRLASLGPR